MRDEVDYLFMLSDDELLIYWQLFRECPTHDRMQRNRLDRIVARLEKERPEEKQRRRKTA